MALHSAQEADLVAKIRKIHQDVIKTMPDHRIAEELAELAARADPEDTVDQVVLSEYEAAAVRRGLVTNPKKAAGFSAAQKKKLRLGWGRLAPGLMASERISTKPPMALALYKKGKKWGSGVVDKNGKLVKLVDDFKHSTAFAAAKSAEKTVLRKNPYVTHPKTGERVWFGSKDIQKLPPGEVDPAQGMPREYMQEMGVHVRGQKYGGPGYTEGGRVMPRGGTSSGDGTAKANPKRRAKAKKTKKTTKKATKKAVRDVLAKSSVPWEWVSEKPGRILASKGKRTVELRKWFKGTWDKGWVVSVIENGEVQDEYRQADDIMAAIKEGEKAFKKRASKRRAKAKKNPEGLKLPELDKLGISYESAQRGADDSIRFFNSGGDWGDVRVHPYEDGTWWWRRFDDLGLDDENHEGQTFERAVREATAEPNPKKKGKRLVAGGKVPKGLSKTLAKRRAKAKKNPIRHTPPKTAQTLRRGYKPTWKDVWGDGSEFGKVFHGQNWTVRITQDEKGHEVTFGPSGDDDEREWLYFSGTGDGDTQEILAEVETRIKEHVKNPCIGLHFHGDDANALLEAAEKANKRQGNPKRNPLILNTALRSRLPSMSDREVIGYYEQYTTMLDTSADPARSFGTEGLPSVKGVIKDTKAEMKRRGLEANPTKKRAPRKPKTLKGRAKRAEKKVEGAAKRAGKRIKKDTKAAGKDVKKFAKTKTGYGALGAGAGALLLGPIGAIAGAVGGSKLHDNPGHPDSFPKHKHAWGFVGSEGTRPGMKEGQLFKCEECGMRGRSTDGGRTVRRVTPKERTGGPPKRRKNPSKEQHHSRGDRKWNMFEEDWGSYTISNSPEDLLGAYTAIVEAELHYAHANVENKDGRGYAPAGAEAAGIRSKIVERLGG